MPMRIGARYLRPNEDLRRRRGDVRDALHAGPLCAGVPKIGFDDPASRAELAKPVYQPSASPVEATATASPLGSAPA
jgi:hypothetical protein